MIDSFSGLFHQEEPERKLGLLQILFCQFYMKSFISRDVIIHMEITVNQLELIVQ